MSEGYPKRELIAQSANGKQVYLNNEHTNVHLHIIENPDLLSLVKEVVQQSEFGGANVTIEKDLGRTVGVTSCVFTDESDQIIYAKRKQRDSFSRFVKHREVESTSLVTVILHEAGDGYELWSAWCGNLVPTVPDAEGALHGDKLFWETHALVYDPEIIQEGTETSEKPW